MLDPLLRKEQLQEQAKTPLQGLLHHCQQASRSTEFIHHLMSGEWANVGASLRRLLVVAKFSSAAHR